MIQARLFQDHADEDRWEPLVQPYRSRQVVSMRTRKPLARQKLLPYMDWDGVSPAPQPGSGEGGSAASTLGVHCQGATRAAIPGGAVCPNCGGTEFDTDGDCTSCWDPGVVGPIAGSGSMEESELPTHARNRRTVPRKPPRG